VVLGLVVRVIVAELLESGFIRVRDRRDAESTDADETRRGQEEASEQDSMASMLAALRAQPTYAHEEGDERSYE